MRIRRTRTACCTGALRGHAIAMAPSYVCCGLMVQLKLFLSSSRRMNLMAAGDGNRVWFPEMIETLRARWNAAMPFPVLIELCNILDGMFQRRRPRGPILPPGSRCPECGRIVGSESQQRHGISVRATILSLGRFGIASPEVTKRIEKEWARYRAD